MNFLKLYIGDYLRDTGTLTVAEHGAYMLMLLHVYATERPLPRGRELHRLLRAETKADREAIDSVASRFWYVTPDGLLNKRADAEMVKANHQREVNRDVGKRGGNPYLKEQYNEPGELYAARLPSGSIKIGITAAGWSKRAYGLSKTYGGRPELLAKVVVQNMGECEAQILAEFAEFASGEVLTLPAELEANLVASVQAKHQPIHQPNRLAITSPNHSQTKEVSKPTASHPPADAAGPRTASVPCPYAAIVSAYHDILPSLPRVKLMPVKRQAAMRKLWGWVLSSRKSDGTRRATNADEALQWLRGYFEHAQHNDFLMGRTSRPTEHAGWQCDLDFLLTDKGMKQVIEKTVEQAAA